MQLILFKYHIKICIMEPQNYFMKPQCSKEHTLRNTALINYNTNMPIVDTDTMRNASLC